MDKEALFGAARVSEADVELAGVGTVRVRGLTRDESIEVSSMADAKLRDRHIIAIGMVEPKLSVSEVKAWGDIRGAVGEMEAVSRKIAELSGMLPGADKQAYKDFEADPGSEFRLLPGAEAGHDGGPSSGGTVQ